MSTAQHNGNQNDKFGENVPCRFQDISTSWRFIMCIYYLFYIYGLINCEKWCCIFILVCLCCVGNGLVPK